MPDAAAIAVIIPAYNAARTLARAVDSVWATGDDNVSVLIIDDGSSDATVEQAAALCAGNPRCRLLRHEHGERRGASASRNLGIESSQSEWVAFLDSDDVYLPHRFHRFREIEAGAPSGGGGFDALYELTELRTEGSQDAEGQWWKGAGDAIFGIRESLSGPALVRQMLTGSFWATSAIVVKRSLLQRTGGFDMSKTIAEDCHLWLRIAARGNVIAGDLDEPVSIYFRHGANSYDYRIEHHLPLLRAMLDAWRWARTNGAAPEILAAFADGVSNYALRSILAARGAGRTDIAAQVLQLMLRDGQVRFLTRHKTLRQVFALARGSWRSSRPEQSAP